MATKIDKTIDRWCRALLDLGRRNRMICYRPSKRRSLEITEPSSDILYERLVARENQLSFCRPIDKRSAPRTHAVLSLFSMLGHPVKVTVGDLDYAPDYEEAQKALAHMRSQYRLAHEEQGCHILYLSFGFLTWRDGKGGKSASPFVRSPLILVPVELSQSTPASPYMLKKRDDDIVINPALQLAFEEKGIVLPPFDDEVKNPSAYFEMIEALAEENGWTVDHSVSLGLLSFQKIAMYRDLQANRARLTANSFVRAMAGTKQAFAQPLSVDPERVPYAEKFSVLPADSSQEKAILAAKRGESFVMEGPPGTGKSQTITNIIAEFLQDGKKVLFVSGKNAALQVVYRRLQETGLAPFCLPLHSHRANKREILGDITASLSLKARRVSENEERELIQLEERRAELNAYRDALHTPAEPLGYTPSECMRELCGNPSAVLTLSSLPRDREALYAWLSLAAKYDEERAVWLSHAPTVPTALFGIRGDADEKALTEALVSLGNALVGLSQAAKRAGISLDALSLDGACAFGRFAEAIAALPDGVFQEGDRAAVKKGLASLDALRAAREDHARFHAVFRPDLARFDLVLWQLEMKTLTATALGDGLVGCLLEDAASHALIGSLDTLIELVELLYTEVSRVIAAHKSLTGSLGISLPLTYEALSAYLAYLPYLSETVSFDRPWQDMGVDENALRYAKKNADAIKAIEREIVKIWRADVFELDYKPLRERFNSNIQGFFAFVTANSRREIKKLLLPYKLDGNLQDADVTALLDRLADRGLMLKRYQHREEALRASLGEKYRGVYTDFDAILSASAWYRSLPSGLLPLPEAICAYFALPASEKPRARAAFGALSDSLGALGLAFHSRRGLAARLDDCYKAESELRLARGRLLALRDKYRAILPYLKTQSDFGALEEAIAAYRRYAVFSQKTDNLSPESEGALTALSALLPFSEDKDALIDAMLTLAADTTAKRMLPALSACSERIGEATAVIAGAFFENGFSSLTLQRAKKRVASLLEVSGSFSRFVPLAELYRLLCERGLGDTVRAYEALSAAESFEAILKNSVLSLQLAKAKKEREALARFSRAKLSRAVASFTTLDSKHTVTARKRIAAKLIGAMPNTEREWRGEDELSILQRENEKRRGHMPLRKLFAKIPNLLQTLKPCFMMSPLSVSYFLEKESYAFDLVIFDEASQLFPEDAIGAVMRGKQVIIVGDPKQLPPTDFFSQHSENGDTPDEEDGDEDYSDTDTSSILESALTVLPRRKLLWHYRSRYESLIAFSNHKIYQKELITFPSPIPDGAGFGVEYCYLPDGVYEAGRGCNLAEAQKAVELLREHIDTKPEKSLGIIAFGKKQQRAIEEAVTAFRLDNPEYESFFDENRDEPFFIKNLENVQGDERDVIIFSIGYGKNARGKFLMNFGPLTKLGGERRLNVAITRAKENIKLIGSVLPSDFNLAATESEGAHLLRAYIDFALHKDKALPLSEKSFGQSDGPDGFVSVVISVLEAAGYTVKRDFGTSQFRVELAVFHPMHTGALAALMTDGEAYRASQTARDREHLRSGILTRMGWRIYTLYAGAWLDDPEREKQALLDFLTKCAEAEGELETVPLSVSEELQETVEPVEVTDTPATTPYGFTVYELDDPARASVRDHSDRLGVASDRMRYLVEREAPIAREWLYRRLAATFRSGKLTESVRKLLDAAWKTLENEGFYADSADFLYFGGFSSPCPRIPRNADEARPLEYIAKEELAEAMAVILSSAVGATPDSLYHELLRVYGCERMTAKLRARCEEALFTLLVRERVRLVDGKLILADSQ